MNSCISPKVTEAIEFAMLAHGGQKRKSGQPFIVHPLSVAFILQSAGYGEEVVIAGILHDVVEDTSYTEKDIQDKFGKRVADLVMGVTANESIKDWLERKELYLEHLKSMDDEVKAISAADMLDNRRAILQSLKEGNADIWKTFDATPEMIMKNSEERLAIVRTLNNEITRELEQVINQLRETIK